MSLKKGSVTFREKGSKVKVEKRLLPCNIKDIYIEFKSKFPDVKNRFSTLCQLKPKWCVTVGRSGSHSVCVCNYHQIIKLMLTVTDSFLHYIDFVKMSACDTNSRDCMTAKCDLCPGFSELKSYLTEFMVKKYREDEMINFKQWERVDRSNLVNCNLDFYDILNDLIDKLKDLLLHHFINKHLQ